MTTAEGAPLAQTPPVPATAVAGTPMPPQELQPKPKIYRSIPTKEILLWSVYAISLFVITNISYRYWSGLTDVLQSVIHQREFILYNGISYSPITFITKKIETKDNKPILIMGHDMVAEIPENIGDLTVETFIIDNNPITTLPDTVGNISSLRYLGVTNTNLTSLPTSIGNNSNLIDLSLQGNRLTRLPDSLGLLQNLEVLNVSYNNISVLPKSMRLLTNVKVLDLTGNKLTAFPTDLPPNLELLYIGNNRISSKNLEAALYQHAHKDIVIYY